MSSTGCPFLIPEIKRIREKHANLASTGCTKEICQAGRAIHTDESRVGENRALREIEREAEEFLHELHQEGFYASEHEFQERRTQALNEIRDSAIDGIARGDQLHTRIGGTWTQTPKELEFGIRRAWRNSRKCIMRSYCEELQLCDLRGVQKSVEMAKVLMKSVCEAFNGGNIQPTAFVFPPRTANGRGPMIWNNQILQFAGYEDQSGAIVGDPASVELTKAIIELGWEPPRQRSRWDLLPVVVMAAGDCPVFIEIPASISKLVEIRHPQYCAAFQQLDLKWVPFPALTKLGFDIGGVQYTAAPFIGWFMDAEIGVRNLADVFRYNALPDVVNVLELTRGKFVDGIEDFEDLPEFEKLAMLSRAQSELNYAVHWSFLQAKISMTDTLTASMKWCRYDDEFKQMHGYRLPADPYWLAPPQGSIIPLWHRGGAPNYRESQLLYVVIRHVNQAGVLMKAPIEPKPMICRHVQDPIKAWQREKHRWPANMRVASASSWSEQPSELPMRIQSQTSALTCEMNSETRSSTCDPLPVEKILFPSRHGMSIAIFYCSAGNIAEKLASKILKWAQMLADGTVKVTVCSDIKPLNSLTVRDLSADKIILLIVSSTGKGDIPVNGSGLRDLSTMESSASNNNFKFAVFGNGDSRYSNTYNGAATKVSALLSQMGGASLTSEVFQGDTAIDSFPLRALKDWWTKIQTVIVELCPVVNDTLSEEVLPKYEMFPSMSVTITAVDDPVDKYINHRLNLLSTLKDGMVVAARPEIQNRIDQTLLISLRIANEPLDELSCVQLLPCTATFKVRKALWALCLEGSEHLDLDSSNPTLANFLTDTIDLELPFLQLEWLESFRLGSSKHMKKLLSKLSVLRVLLFLRTIAIFTPGALGRHLQRDICLDMPLLCSRTYSIASIPRNQSPMDTSKTKYEVDIMVKVYPGGRFSDTFLNDCASPAALKYRIVDSVSGPQLRRNHMAPSVIVATGAGFGPVRCLLQWRVATIRKTFAARQQSHPWGSGISLFLGLKECDLQLVVDVLNEAMSVNLIDRLDIVLSNPEKRRVYDHLTFAAQHIRDKILSRRGMIFICAGGLAAEGAKRMFERILGGHVEAALGERYVEEVY